MGCNLLSWTSSVKNIATKDLPKNDFNDIINFIRESLENHRSQAFELQGGKLMRYIITGKNIDVTEGLKNAIYEKIGKLEKYFKPDTEVHATFSVQKDRHKIEITIPIKGTVIRAEEESTDMYVSIDLVEEIIERQIKKYKSKIVDAKQNGTGLSEAFASEPGDEEEIIITRTKKFAMKPMDPEEACIEMELSGHNFFVFRNSETGEVNVVYKRKGNTYGLIEPEF